MDVDGTLTDGKIYMSEKGELFKAFDIKDGCGIHDILPHVGIIPAVITARKSNIVENRCKELNIKYCYQGYRDKAEALIELIRSLGLHPDENGVYRDVAYIGDDIIDIPCMKLCGLNSCPIDAAKEVKRIANFVSSKNGGQGAVREFIDWLVEQFN